MKIYLDDICFDVAHRTNKKIKRISIAFESKYELLIRTPLRIKPNEIKDIIFNYKSWILGTLNTKNIKEKFDFFKELKLPFLGKNYTTNIILDENLTYNKMILKDDCFELRTYNKSIKQDEILNLLSSFYKKQAKNIINPIFESLYIETNLKPEKVTYRKAKRRWGSCSHTNNISINYMLLQFGIDAIEYVVLHELCHIKEKNHSRKFYNLVSSYMQDYKAKEQILKYKYF